MDKLATAIPEKLMMDAMVWSSEPESIEAKAQRQSDSYNAMPGHLNDEDGYDCPICKNKGMVSYVGEPDAFGYPTEYYKPCKCCKVRNALRRLARSGLKDLTKKYTLERYEAQDAWQQAIKQKAVEFCQDTSGAWFFIGGQSGAGKTHICTAIAVQLIRQGNEVRYMVWQNEAPQIKAMVNEPAQYTSMLKELKEADVLYIDDLFKNGRGYDGQYQPPTPADVKLAFEIINYRYNNPRLVTIISCERTLQELNEWDEGVAGRIGERSKEAGYCISLKKDKAKNWRMKGVMEL